MKTLTRRDFLKSALIGAAGVGGVLLAGCADNSEPESTDATEESTAPETSKSEIVENKEIAQEELPTVEQTSIDENGKRFLRVGYAVEMSSMAPFIIYTGRGLADKNLYEELAIRISSDGDLQPVIAKSWTLREDNVTVDVEIYDYVHDTAGNHIKASDVAFCYEQYIASGYDSITESVEETGEYTLTFKMKAAQVGGAEKLLTGCPIVSKDAYLASVDGMATAPIGTTPYVIQDYVVGSHTSLTKVGDYWQTDEDSAVILSKGTVDDITYVTIKEPSQMTVALETKTIDAVDNVDSTQLTYFDPNADGTYSEDFTLLSIPFTQGYWMFFSGDDSSPVHDDVNLRLAILYAVDSQGVVDAVLQGYGYVTNMSGLKAHLDYTDKFEGNYFNYNPELAKEYLAKSNYNNEAIRILSPSSALFQKLNQVIQGYLMAIGINAEVCAYESALYQTYFRTPSEFDIGLTRCGTNYAVDTWFSFLCATSTGTDRTKHGIYDPHLDELVCLVNTVEGHTEENIIECQQYLIDMGYGKEMCGTNKYFIVRNDTGATSITTYGNFCAWWCTQFAE